MAMISQETMNLVTIFVVFSTCFATFAIVEHVLYQREITLHRAESVQLQAQNREIHALHLMELDANRAQTLKAISAIIKLDELTLTPEAKLAVIGCLASGILDEITTNIIKEEMSDE